jgi:Protein of unknown function (DUF2934)
LVSELKNARKEGIDMAQQAMKLAVVPAMPLDSPETRPMHEEICALAYSLWQARGCPEGTAEEDWFRAETQSRLKLGPA